MTFAWSKPYFGITHCGKSGTDRWWLTVRDYGTSAELLCWYPGCAFHPHESNHASAEAAKAAGEAWLLRTTATSPENL